jgi:cytoskeletal protein CcmA (bactofilin family)
VIEIDVDDYTADVLNQGTLAFRDGEADSKAQGILLTGDLSGTVTNEGLIELNVSDNDDVTLYGIEVEGDVSGTISNLGTIDVFGAATGNFVSVAGVRIGGELTGTVRNDGMIVVEAREDTETASAWGIYVDAVGATALIENNGTIEARASTFSSSDANAWGIEIDGDLVLGARVLNSGTIEAEAESVSSSVFARGLEINGELAGQLTNTGDIVATAIGSGTEVDDVLAWGIDVDGDLSGSLLNEGRIEATVETIAIDETTEGRVSEVVEI